MLSYWAAHPCRDRTEEVRNRRENWASPWSLSCTWGDCVPQRRNILLGSVNDGASWKLDGEMRCWVFSAPSLPWMSLQRSLLFLQGVRSLQTSPLEPPPFSFQPVYSRNFWANLWANLWAPHHQCGLLLFQYWCSWFPALNPLCCKPLSSFLTYWLNSNWYGGDWHLLSSSANTYKTFCLPFSSSSLPFSRSVYFI